MKVLELFAGSRSIGKEAERQGHEVFSIDVKPFEGIDMVIDIENLYSDFININHATVIWHCNDTEYLLKQDKVFYGNYLRVQGQPVEGKSERDYFDLAIANHLKR